MLLVSDNTERADMIRQLMQRHNLRGELHRVRLGHRAIQRVRREKGFHDSKRYDLVLLDFATPDERRLPAVGEIAFRRKRKQAPVVLLTSPDSESLLSQGPFAESAAELFSPLGLFEFFARARDNEPNRFLRAVRVIAKFGPLLVRLPGFVAECPKSSCVTHRDQGAAASKVA